jgi:hypothetical protein
MKKMLLACVIASILIGNPLRFNLEQYSTRQQTSITGKISPEEAADVALIIHAKDTLKTPVVWGNFSQQVKPGTYKLVVSAKAPFKNVSLGNLEVKRNHVLNVGELILQK